MHFKKPLQKNLTEKKSPKPCASHVKHGDQTTAMEKWKGQKCLPQLMTTQNKMEKTSIPQLQQPEHQLEHGTA